MPTNRQIAYFSMEVALDVTLPTYSGGLGVLAGDTLRAAADMALPVVAVTLLYRRGFFQQGLDARGRQAEAPVQWDPAEQLRRLPVSVTVMLEGRPVLVSAWEYTIHGEKGHTVPVYFLDTSHPSNAPEHQTLTDQLYGGDEAYRLGQEAVLGLAGVAVLKALGHVPAADIDAARPQGLTVYHMNEGHAALLTVALLEHRAGAFDALPPKLADLDWVRQRCVFTTHTPVPAGHDTFPLALAETVLGVNVVRALKDLDVCPEGRLNMSALAMRMSRFANGVAKRHAEVSRLMFPGVRIEAITNGVHAATWTADAIRELFDEHLAGWREDNNYLRYACEIPLEALQTAHRGAKAALLRTVKERTGVGMDTDVFTLGFARRAAEYKRADLLFNDLETLRGIAKRQPLQIIYAGKAHPKDDGGKKLIERVFAGARELPEISMVYLENYDMDLGRLITSGVDLWLNNPLKPLEASGTSGMKAAINGVPSLSTLDGWWVEGCIENLVGWEIQDTEDAFAGVKATGQERHAAAMSLYSLLDEVIMPTYYQEPAAYARIMRNCMFLNGAYFNTHRMVLQYFVQAYTRRQGAGRK